MPCRCCAAPSTPGEHNWFEIRRGIVLVPVKSATIPPATHTNCLIVGEESLYVIDPGPGDDAEVAPSHAPD